MHHEQDMRKMGGLRKYMPITYITAVIGESCFGGDSAIRGVLFQGRHLLRLVHASDVPGAGFAWIAVLLAVFITAFYSFRLLFMTFHGDCRADEKTKEHLHESPWVVTLPLVLLAIPSIFAGMLFFEPMLFGDFFRDAIFVLPAHDTLAVVGEGYHGKHGIGLVLGAIGHGMLTLPFWLAVAGIAFAWLCYMKMPHLPAKVSERFSFMHRLLERKYWFDEIYQRVFSDGARAIGTFLWRQSDTKLIDGFLVNGTARSIGRLSAIVRHIQSGFVYHYAFAMIIGLVCLMSWMIFK